MAWGYNGEGQTDVPAPNTDFIAVAAGRYQSLGLKEDGSIVAWGRNDYDQTNVPAPNTGFIAVAGGGDHSLAIRPMDPPPPWVWGDYHGDRMIGLDDFAALAERWDGPDRWPSVAGWHLLDLNGDFDVDLGDFAEFQILFAPPP